jgi:hypothetical protein
VDKGAATGAKLSDTTAPPSGWLSAWTVPPRLSAAWRTIAQVDDPVADAGNVLIGVELDVGEAQQAPVRPLDVPADERAQPRLKLADVVGLDQVVVGAGVEAGDAIRHLDTRGEHQHRRAVAAVAERAADLQAVDVGQADVEHDDVG